MIKKAKNLADGGGANGRDPLKLYISQTTSINPKTVTQYCKLPTNFTPLQSRHLPKHDTQTLLTYVHHTRKETVHNHTK
jgi:hypothetical protein